MHSRPLLRVNENTSRTKKEPEYNIKFTDEREGQQRKEEEQRVCKREYAGNTSKLYPRETIEKVGAYKSPGLVV